jgi:hypothetical protein
MAQKLTSSEVRQILVSFLDGSGRPWDWDDFTSVPIADLALDRIRERCAGLWDEFPPERPNEYCAHAGKQVILEFIQQLTPSVAALRSNE